MSFRRAVRIHLFSRYKQMTQSREIRRYFRSHEVRKLNLGCGSNSPEGWLNVDLHPRWNAVFMDAGRRWPFPDACLDSLLCEHMIEHVPKSVARRLIGEAFRTLAPGAKARFITPDLTVFSRMLLHPEQRKFGEAYTEVMRKFYNAPQVSWCDLLNYCFYEHGHRYIYTPEELRAELTRAGFVDIVETRAAFPADPVFRGAEGHVRVVGAECDAFEAFALEAVKPQIAGDEARAATSLPVSVPRKQSLAPIAHRLAECSLFPSFGAA